MAGEWDAFPVATQPAVQPAAKEDPWSAFPAVQAKAPPAEAPTAPGGSGLGRGLVEGAGSILGMPADVWHMIDRGYQHALTRGAQAMGLLTPEQAEGLRAPITANAPTTMRSLVTGEHPTDNIETSPISSEVINRHLLNAAKAAGANTEAPTSTAGQYAETAASFLPGAAALGPATTGAKAIAGSALKYGAIPALTSETAGQITKGTEAEPYARFAGALAPGGVQAAMSKLSDIANPVQRVLRNATQGVTPAQMSDAQALLDKSRAAGAPVTVPEAVSKASNGASTLPELQRSIEESRTGAPIMKQFYADRPAQVDALGSSTFDQIAPGAADPYAVAPKVQEAAQGVMKDATKARTAAVDPLYEAANPTTVPVDEMNAHLDQIDQMIARDKTGLTSPTLSKLRDALTETPAADGQPRIPVTDIENLDRARKFFRDKAELPYGVSPDALDKETSAKVLGLLGDDGLKGIMTRASPDFEQGLQQYQDISKNVVNPMADQPIGRLADTNDFTKQNQILFNSKPVPGSHVGVSDAVRQIAAKDPEAASQSVRMFLEQQFEAATKGDAQQGAAKFFKNVYDNDQQRRNIQAALRALPDGQVKADAFEKFMDIASAMKERLPGNSATAMKQEINKLLQSGNIPAELLARAPALLSPGKLAGMGADAYAKISSGKNGAQLAKIFTEGNVSDLQALTKAGSQSVRGRLLVLGLLSRAQGVSSQERPQP